MAWQDRFRATATIHAGVAEGDESRGVLISNLDGAYQAHAWETESGELRRVTEGDAATLDVAITPDGESVLFLIEDVPGSEFGHLHAVPFAGGAATDLTPDLPPYSPFGVIARGPYVAWAAGIEGGVEALVIADGQVRQFGIDGSPMGIDLDADRGWLIINEAPAGQGMVGNVRVVDIEDGSTVGTLARATAGAVFDGTIAVALHRGEWDRPAVWVPGSEPEAIPSDFDGDVTPAAWSADGTTILLRQEYRGQSGLAVFDIGTGATTALTTPSGALIQFGSLQILEDRTALCVWSDWEHPFRPIRVGVDGWTEAVPSLTSRFEGPSWTEVAIPSTTDEPIQGWLMTPNGEGPFPSIVHTHGGPTAVHQPVFNRMCQSWVECGFAVLSVNFRGSTTFGVSFREALTGHIGGPDVEDVVAAHAWLVDNGIADPARIIKSGYSYGGYLTLQALGTHPDLWLCGIAGAPVADWIGEREYLSEILRAYTISLFDGDVDDRPEAYRDASPITHVAAVTAPLLISQPENDTRTPLPPVQAYVDRMIELGKDVELDVLPAGHAGSGVEDEIALFSRWLAYAKEHIGV